MGIEFEMNTANDQGLAIPNLGKRAKNHEANEAALNLRHSREIRA